MMRYDPDYFAETLAMDSGIYKVEEKRRRRRKKTGTRRAVNPNMKIGERTATTAMAPEGPEQRTYKGKLKRPPRFWNET